MERGLVSGRSTRKAAARGNERRRSIAKRRLRLVWVIAVLGLSAYLYYQPLASYVETRSDLKSRRAEVESLRAMRADLELRLVNARSLEATQREARRIGYVLPGEQLFVVKGIPAWRKAQRRLQEHG